MRKPVLILCALLCLAARHAQAQTAYGLDDVSQPQSFVVTPPQGEEEDNGSVNSFDDMKEKLQAQRSSLLQKAEEAREAANQSQMRQLSGEADPADPSAGLPGQAAPAPAGDTTLGGLLAADPAAEKQAGGSGDSQPANSMGGILAP